MMPFHDIETFMEVMNINRCGICGSTDPNIIEEEKGLYYCLVCNAQKLK